MNSRFTYCEIQIHRCGLPFDAYTKVVWPVISCVISYHCGGTRHTHALKALHNRAQLKVLFRGR